MQVFEKISKDASQLEAQTRKLTLTAGTWFGIFFGFSFAIFAWGFDLFQLASNFANLAWVKFAIGLPTSIILCGLVGRLTSLSTVTGVFVVGWAVVGWLLGTFAGHIPFDVGNLSTWLADRRLWGEIIFSYDNSAAVRTTLAIIATILLGTFTGLLESLVVHWSWDRKTPDNRMSFGSWTVLLVSVPMALFMSLPIDTLINQPLRKHQQAVGTLIRQSLADEIDESSSDYRTISPFREMLSDDYIVHFVAFGGDKQSWYSAYVDVVFTDGYLLRCATSGDNVIYCDDFSEKFTAWMGDLVRAGLYDERPWLDAKIRRLSVDDTVLGWLESHRARLSDNYDIQIDTEQSGWIFMSAKFDTGFEMTCRFHDASPIVVDQCVEVGLSSDE